jgi:hypothetical protein
MLSLSSHVRAVISRDGAAILDVSRNRVTNLNSTGGLIWDRLQQGRSIELVVQEIATACDMDCSIVERDVHEFLHQLEAIHLIQR